MTRPSECLIFTWLPLRCTTTKPNRFSAARTSLEASSGSFTRFIQLALDLHSIPPAPAQDTSRSLHEYSQGPPLWSYPETSNSSAKGHGQRNNHFRRARPLP